LGGQQAEAYPLFGAGGPDPATDSTLGNFLYYWGCLPSGIATDPATSPGLPGKATPSSLPRTSEFGTLGSTIQHNPIKLENDEKIT
jgi:hypothetical protein